VLGLLWEKEELFKPEVRPDAGVEQLHVPLSLVLNPDLLKQMRDWVQKGKDKSGKPIKELGALSRDEFIEFYRQHTTLNAGLGKKD
jgi:hypothetical protein